MENRHAAQQHFVSRQSDYFRLAARDCDLTVKRLALLTDIPATTMATWASGTVMPAWAMWELSRHVPDYLNSMLAERSGKFVGTCEPSEGDLDALGREGAGYTSALFDARAPESPGGSVVTPIERAGLRDRARRVASRARAVAA